MNFSLCELPNPVKIVFEISANELSEEFDKCWEKIKDQVEIDGFRKGQVPKDIAENKLGCTKLYQGVIKELYDKAIIENDVKIIYSKDFKMYGDFARGKGFKLENVVYLFPKMKLPDDPVFNTKFQKAMVTDEEVYKRIEHLQSTSSGLTVVDREVKKGDVIKFDFTGFIDGNKFNGGSAKDFILEVGSNKFIPGFENQLVGLKKNEEFTVNVVFPKNYLKKELANKEASFIVVVKEIKEKNPLDLNLFLQKFNCKTVEELKEQQTEQLLQAREIENKRLYDSQLLREYVEQCKIDTLPDEFLDSEIEKRYDSYLNKLNITESELDKKIDNSRAWFKATNKKSIIDECKSILIIEKMIDIYDIRNTTEEVDGFLQKHYQTDNENLQKIAMQSNKDLKREFADHQLKIEKVMEKIKNWAS